MAEVPSVMFHLERYAALGVDGISIGSNDLTQLMLGVDRDSEVLARLFDERDPAVIEYLRPADRSARELGLQTSICGQAPSVYPEYAELLVGAGIDAISVNTDAVDRARHLIAAAEQRVVLENPRRSTEHPFPNHQRVACLPNHRRSPRHDQRLGGSAAPLAGRRRWQFGLNIVAVNDVADAAASSSSCVTTPSTGASRDSSRSARAACG